MEKPIIAVIPAEMARPFVHDYCERKGLTYDTDYECGADIAWVGAFFKGSLCAIKGYFEILPGEMLVYGPYGNGTRYETYSKRCLTNFFDKLPFVDTIRL